MQATDMVFSTRFLFTSCSTKEILKAIETELRGMKKNCVKNGETTNGWRNIKQTEVVTRPEGHLTLTNVRHVCVGVLHTSIQPQLGFNLKQDLKFNQI